MGSLDAPRGLWGSTPPQPIPEGPITAIGELGGAEYASPRVVGWPPRHPVCAPHPSSWSSRSCGERVCMLRGTQDSSRALPGQEALQLQWEAWAGRLTTTGPGQLAPLCALGFLSSKDSTTRRASEARAALWEGLCSPRVCSGPVMPGQSLMAGCTLGSPGACLLFLLALGSRVG